MGFDSQRGFSLPASDKVVFSVFLPQFLWRRLMSANGSLVFFVAAAASCIVLTLSAATSSPTTTQLPIQSQPLATVLRSTQQLSHQFSQGSGRKISLGQTPRGGILDVHGYAHDQVCTGGPAIVDACVLHDVSPLASQPLPCLTVWNI